MDNKVEIFNNERLKMKVRAIKNDDGSISVSAEDTAIGYGWIDKTKEVGTSSYIRWARINGYIKELTGENSPQVAKDDYIPESLFYLLGMKAKNDIAKEFQKWLAIDVIPSIRKTGGYLETSNNSIAKLENVSEFIEKLDKRTTELGQYYKPSHKKKLDINKYIKQCLGTIATRENCDRAKDMLLMQLGYSIYDEVPIDLLHSTETAKKIFDICYMISVNNHEIQTCLEMYK